MSSSYHIDMMRYALQLASCHVGCTWPNPVVGAVVVHNNIIVGTGITARGGRPHAETEALKQAGDKAKGGTLYVTLEPCSHQGQTAPCADAIIESDVKTVVIACTDPNPLVAGQGIQGLRQHGIEVIEGVCAQEAITLNRGFFSVIEKKRPYIALKIASSLDGKIATATGENRWITSKTAREYGHILRSRYDAIATGIGTVLADDPLLTCRLPGLENHSPVRVIFDTRGRLPADSQLIHTAQEVPVWPVSGSVEHVVSHLTAQGITRLLVEAGPTLSTAFLRSGMVDRIYWFRAPIMMGDGGQSAILDGFSSELATLARWNMVEHISLHPDSLDILECLPASSNT